MYTCSKEGGGRERGRREGEGEEGRRSGEEEIEGGWRS